ncbi:hypothetical protein MBRA_04087 [Methylobacterium brachiatum]|uniref:DUF971 domain-containing protein n=1 Tax=Methylobacterium sp. J-048 TaxID=2836635 RepID=UPI001381D147|nr:DUF971 domain-containing protein [Methylobacterium sp. J-048]MCJ2055683.1 DUF971 domain-containing protein [Methylobacterium sp. J-048]CAA2158833.1 hypothetical protein MBRA_04087 [Methylobacterium brachiatum]
MADHATGLPNPPPFDPGAIPEGATLSRGGLSLRLQWSDGLVATLPAERLRLRCRCAWCTRDRVENRFPEAFGGITVTKVEPMGGYAVHIAFSDGHARGIFPWSYLRALAAEAPPVALQAAPRKAA